MSLVSLNLLYQGKSKGSQVSSSQIDSSSLILLPPSQLLVLCRGPTFLCLTNLPFDVKRRMIHQHISIQDILSLWCVKAFLRERH